MSTQRFISLSNGHLAEVVPITTSSGTTSAGSIPALNANGLIDSSMLSSILVASISLAPTAAGNFQVAHGLGTTPSTVFIQMTSGGAIWFQTTRYDSTYIYLVASAANITGYAEVLS